MPAFTYTALSQQGKEQKGILEGDNARQIREQLRAQLLTPIEVTAVSEQAASLKTSLFNREHKKLKPKELSVITRQLATLIAAGMPLAECLQTVAEQNDKPYIKKIIMGVRASVLEGHSFADGLEKFPYAFPMIYRATIGAGEHSGKLDTVLERLADFTEKQHYTRQKITQALVYPILMTVVSLGIVAFLLTYVVPRMINVFTQTGQQLPGVTQVLLFVSEAVKSYGIYGLIISIIAIFIFRTLIKRSTNFRYKIHRLLLRLPIIGNATKTVNTARFARSFGILFTATVPVLDAMHASNRLVTSLPIQKAISTAINKVREGGIISTALRETNYFPPMSIHLIASGESSGQLDNMLERAADNQERDVAMLVDRVLTLFEPALILVMGAVVLFVVLAVMLPIFSLDQFAG